MDLIDHEDIVSSLEEIVNKFSDKMGPYSFDLLVHLSKIFLKYCKKSEEQLERDEDNGGETEMAASGCLEAIKRILNNNLD